jgi:hypothetical protein
MGNPFINYNNHEAIVLLRGLYNTELFSKITVDGNRIIYYYNIDYNVPTVFWYENQDGTVFIDGYGIGTLTSSGLNYVNYKLSQYKFVF